MSNKTEELEKKIKEVVENILESGYHYEEGDHCLLTFTSQILEVFKQAGGVLVDKEQGLTEVPLHYYKWREVWFDAQKELRDKAGYKRVIELP